jgi:hypothetical protein
LLAVVLELIESVARDAVELDLQNPGLSPFAIRTELDVAHDGLEGALAQVVSELVLIEALGGVDRLAERSLRYVKRIGDLLNEAKEIVGHGNFMNWVDQNCPFSHPTANNYMFVARHLAQSGRFVRVINLAEQGTVDRLGKLVAKHAAVKVRRQAAQERAQRGEPERQPLTIQRMWWLTEMMTRRRLPVSDPTPLRREQ